MPAMFGIFIISAGLAFYSDGSNGSEVQILSSQPTKNLLFNKLEFMNYSG
jgi:hypothetical protein